LEQGRTTNEAFNIPIPDHLLHNVSVSEDEIEHDTTAVTFLTKITAVSTRNQKVFLIQCVLVYLMERKAYIELTLQEGVERHGLQI
jgi:hypothetical protein